MVNHFQKVLFMLVGFAIALLTVFLFGFANPSPTESQFVVTTFGDPKTEGVIVTNVKTGESKLLHYRDGSSSKVVRQFGSNFSAMRSQ